ncbi:MAG: hypothetical protein H6613_00320 [Ignavibacteriales bacterium]|nr:hypothetical protein [Ignavibacteriales bacterium]
MKLKILVFIFLVFFVSLTTAQTVDKVNEVKTKIESPEEFERLYGKLFGERLNKVTGETKEIKSIIIKGNKIQTIMYNYGSVCRPGGLADIEDLVWNGLGYGYEFGLLAGAKVPSVQPGIDSVTIISDSHVSPSEGDYDAGGTQKWGWLPKAGYTDPTQNNVASLNAADNNGDGKPDSWPESWYSPGAGKYLWPAFLGDASTAPDEEVYYAIDDYTNYEYIGDYQPFVNNPAKAGLGLDSDVRMLQFNNPLAEDLLFSVYQMTNASDKDLDNFYMGMFGDPHIGGVGDTGDDMAFFIPPTGELAEKYDQRQRSMVYGWDKDAKGRGGKKPGYFGWKFLESPSIATDSKDNDDDGITDETPFNSKGEYIDGGIIPINTGISDIDQYTKVNGKPKPRWSGDEDGDWNPEKNDVGIDGIGPESTNYPGKDYGEGDGYPSQAWYNDLNGNGKYDPDEVGTLTDDWSIGKKWAGSEPNFGFRDISESDQLGLTGFTVNGWGIVNPKDDEIVWSWLTKPEIDPNQEFLQTAGDNIFCFSTGPMMLAKGESQRFSMVILFGEDLNDLRLNATTSVRILEADYQFAQPPDKPIVTAVPGDGRVTLYWDAKSEQSIDPLTSEQDFEGYKIYRSRDFNFSDVYKITDANGIAFLGQALFDANTGLPAQFDLVNDYSGLAAVEYPGRGVKYDLGDNTGLVHEYVDSTVQNGERYYYAVVAYDRGTDELPPTETQSVIQEDPTTGNLIYDVNTLSVIPGPIGSGIKESEVGIGGAPTLMVGNATGKINLKVLDDLSVDNKNYKVSFDTTNSYSVLDDSGVSYSIISKGTVLVSLRHKNIVPESIELKDEDGTVVSADNYVVNTLRGQIAGVSDASLPAGKTYTVSYKYYPVYQSTLINNEDGNDVFDGMRIFVQEDQINVNNEESRFITDSKITVVDNIIFPPILGGTKVKLRADWELRWNNLDTTATGAWVNADTTETLVGSVATPFSLWYIVEKAPNYYLEEPATFVLYEPDPAKQNNGRWDWGEGIIFQPQGATDPTVSYQLTLSLNKEVAQQVLPKQGDIYKLSTYKPFEKGDLYSFETKKAEFLSTNSDQSLNDVYVVPNPYVAYSESENPGRTQIKRGERELQFRNLPPVCTIRIYTITGELVDKIEKNDNGSIAYWDLLSSEGMRISYGVYIFHVDAPGVGEKIGRFGVIK